jgi:hypothetical protein
MSLEWTFQTFRMTARDTVGRRTNSELRVVVNVVTYVQWQWHSFKC